MTTGQVLTAVKRISERDNDEYDSDAIDSGGDDSSDVILPLICDSDEDANERLRASYHKEIRN